MTQTRKYTPDDGEHVYEGYPTPQRWNGWHCPKFLKDTAIRILTDFGLPADDEGLNEWDSADDLNGETLYTVGGWEWTWEMSDEQDEDFARRMTTDDWLRFFGQDVDAADYAAGCEIDLTERIAADLTDLWLNAEAGDRLTADQIAIIAPYLSAYAARQLYDRNNQYVELTD
jgi:hypothetical protein